MRQHLVALLVSVLVVGQPSYASLRAIDGGVTAGQIDGVWRLRDNDFVIQALSGNRVRVQFVGLRPYETPSGPSAKICEFNGIATLDGNIASLRPDAFTTDECEITIRFDRGRLYATQKGDCCSYVVGVQVDGTYKRVSRKPRFVEA